MDLKDKRCFIEELPTDTVVEGTRTLPVWQFVKRASSLTRDEPGQYRALEWHEGEQKYKENPQMGVLVEVTVCTLDLPLRHQKTELASQTKNPSFSTFGGGFL
jgi:hypothetical protein